VNPLRILNTYLNEWIKKKRKRKTMSVINMKNKTKIKKGDSDIGVLK
jgi:flagellar biosynthesis chaperone FliJ